MKKILVVLLALCMVFAMMPIAAMAEESVLEPLTGVGIEFSADKAPVAEDWTLTGSKSSVGTTIYLDNANANSYITGTYNSLFNLTNGFTATYVVGGRYYNNYAMGNTYLGICVGNITVGPEVLDSAKSAVVLKIRINDTVVATSSNIFDSTSSGWDSSKSNASNINVFMGGFAVNTLTLDYDTETKTLTYGYGDKVVTYVDEAGDIDVSAATVALKTHASWSGYASYKSLKLEGKAPSLKGIYVTTGGIDVDGFNTTDWTPSKDGVIADASNALNAQKDRNTVKATSNGTYTIGDEFEMSFTYTVGDYNNYYGDGVITFGTNKIGVGNLGTDTEPTFYAYVKTSAGTVAQAYVGAKDKTAINGVYVFTYKDGMLSGTVDDVALNWDVAEGTATEIAVTFDEATNVNFVGSITGNYGPGKYIKNFSWYEAGTTYTLHEINEAMGTLADASLETYAEAAATIDTVMPLLSQENKDLLTNLAVYEKYKTDYAEYQAYINADAEIVAKNATYTLINGMYAEDWKDVTGSGAFYRGNTVFGDVTATGDGFYANSRGQYSMTSVNPLATANNYFKIVQKSTQSEYNDSNFKWTIGDLTIGIYVDGNNASNSNGDTGYNDGKRMAIFQIFYKGELVKVITGEANNYGLDTSVDPCSTWMLANCEFTITYDNGNLMITFFNGVTKYVTPKTGLDLNTLIDGFNYNPNGNHVKLDIFASYSQLRFNKLVITGKANKAAVDNLAALAQTNPGAAKLIYDSISDKSIVDDATAAILNGEFAISAAGPYDVVIGDGNYNSKDYRYGDTVTFTAVDNDCFIFTGWYDGEDNLISEDPVYTCVIAPNVSLVATIDEINSKKHCDTHTVIENNVDPECETEGSYDNVVYCDYCGEELSRETITVDTLGHTVVIDEAVAPTLNSTGLTEGAHCDICGEVLVPQEVVPMVVGEASIVGGLNYATLEEAVAAANDGDVIVLNLDVTTEDILVITKAITLDGNGHTLTYTGKGASARAINVDCAGDVAIIDIVVDAANAERAINVINKAGNLTLTEVTAVASHYPVNVAATAAGATVTINDSDLTGLNVVNIRANNVTVEINDSKLTVIDESNTESYAAIFVGKEVVDGSVAMNGGEVVLGGDSSAASYWSNVEVTFTDVIGADKVATVVATIGDAGYTTLEDAIAAAKAGETITLLRDVTIDSILVIDKAITLNGNGHTLTYTGVGSNARAININVDGDVTIKNLTIDAAKAERAINVIQKPANVTIDNVTATASNYTVNLAASAAGAVVAITDSTLTGLNVVNVAAPNAVVTVDETILNVNDKNSDENYSALSLNKDALNGSIAATNVTFNILDDSVKARNGAVGGTITIDDSDDEVDVDVAYIAYGNYYNGYSSLEDAVAAAKDGETIVLLRDITLTESVRIAKKVTIDLNGKTITANFEDAYGALYVAMAGDLTLIGDGAINSTDIAIGVYGKLTVNGVTVSGDYAAIYNFYYNASTYGQTTVTAGTVQGWVLNCGKLAVNGGTVEKIDNSGALAVNGGAVEHIYGRDGGDAAGVEGAGTIAIADPSAIEVPEGYVLLEVDGVYKVHTHSYTAVVTAPDCVNGGYTTYTCDCGDSYVADYTDALGHTWGEWEITTEATAAAPGVKTRTCGTCGETETEEYVLDNAGVTGEVTWRFEDGTIYIEGTGAMDDYLNQGHTVPWMDYRTQTTAVVIGDGVTHVGNRAFRGFNRIITVTFGNDVETMGYEAFYLCNKITTVTLNEGLTNIGSLAFYGCTALKQIEIPSTVATLDNRCFKGAGLTSIVVPNTVTYTGYEVFMNCASLETVEYSTGVQFVNSRVFENCTSLKSFYVANNIQRLRTGAFYGCTALESVTFEDANNMWPTPDGSSAKIASNTFEGCNSSLKLIADEGTHVESYAARHGFVFEAK